MNKYEELASEAIDTISSYIEDHYRITYKDKKTKKESDKDPPEKDRALIYGEDYYNMEDEIANKIKLLCGRQTSKSTG